MILQFDEFINEAKGYKSIWSEFAKQENDIREKIKKYNLDMRKNPSKSRLLTAQIELEMVKMQMIKVKKKIENLKGSK